MKPKTLFTILTLLFLILGTAELVCFLPLKDFPEATGCRKDIIILFGLAVIFFITSLYINKIEVHPKQNAYDTDDEKHDQNDLPQVSIELCCDEGYAADFLRELANHLEERSDENTNFEYETEHGYAEIKYE